MNSNSRDYLIQFIQSVEDFAMAVSSVAGTQAVESLINKAEDLKECLERDETIP